MVAKLECIIGRAGTGKTYTCLNAMKKSLEELPLGNQRLLIIPDYMTYKMERVLAGMLDKKAGFLQAYLFSFNRLAQHILSETGGGKIPYINDIGRRILVYKIISDDSSALKTLGTIAHKQGFADNMVKTLTEMKRYCIDKELLMDIANELDKNHHRTADKLKDISYIAQELEKHMADKLNDKEDNLLLLANKIEQAKSLKGADVWLDGFLFFTSLELAVIGEIMKVANSVNITFTMDGEKVDNNEDSFINVNTEENKSEIGLFNRSYRTFRQIQELYQGIGGDKLNIKVLENNKRSKKDSLLLIERYLMSNRTNMPSLMDGVKIIEAANQRIEVEAIAADIIRLARDENYRYRDIGVLVRDNDNYSRLIPLIFKSHDIPFFDDSKRKAVNHPLAELICSVTHIVTKGGWLGFQYENIFRALKTGLFKSSYDEIEKLENYVLAFGIKGIDSWRKDEPWSYYLKHSLEDTNNISDEQVEYNANIDRIRREAIVPLVNFYDVMLQAKTVLTKTKALYDFLLTIDVPRTLEKWQLADEDNGYVDDSKIHRQLWTRCIDLMDQLVELCGDSEIDNKKYEELLQEGLDELKISLIPSSLDNVIIASFDQNSLDDCRAIYILGANAGVMPRYEETTGIISDIDRYYMRETLSKVAHKATVNNKTWGQDVFFNGREKNFNERYRLYKGFNEAQEYLCISYPLANNNGEALLPSNLVKKLMQAKVDFLSIPLETIKRNDYLRISAKLPAVSSMVGALIGLKNGEDFDELWQSVYNWILDNDIYRSRLELIIEGLFTNGHKDSIPPDLARRLFFKNNKMIGSVTKIQKFHECPFAYFANYGIKLKEREIYSYRKNDLGTLLHTVLKKYAEWVKNRYNNNWHEVSKNEQEQKISYLIDSLAPQVKNSILSSTNKHKQLVKRLIKTATTIIAQLSSWSAATEFAPMCMEESFGRHSDKFKIAEIKLNGGYSIVLTGQIDRIDTDNSQEYFLIIDYKSGLAELDINEIYHGLSMQLILYLMVASEFFADTKIPAGLFYIYLKNPILKNKNYTRIYEDELLTKELNKELKFKGWVIDNTDIVRRIDKEQKHIAIKLKQDGDFDKATKDNKVRTEVEFRILMDYLRLLIKDTGERILNGYIAVSPFKNGTKNACTYCQYKAVCGFNPSVIVGHRYRYLDTYNIKSSDEFIEKMKSMIAENNKA